MLSLAESLNLYINSNIEVIEYTFRSITSINVKRNIYLKRQNDVYCLIKKNKLTSSKIRL